MNRAFAESIPSTSLQYAPFRLGFVGGLKLLDSVSQLSQSPLRVSDNLSRFSAQMFLALKLTWFFCEGLESLYCIKCVLELSRQIFNPCGHVRGRDGLNGSGDHRCSLRCFGSQLSKAWRILRDISYPRRRLRRSAREDPFFSASLDLPGGCHSW